MPSRAWPPAGSSPGAPRIRMRRQPRVLRREQRARRIVTRQLEKLAARQILLAFAPRGERQEDLRVRLQVAPTLGRSLQLLHPQSAVAVVPAEPEEEPHRRR